MYHNKYMLFWNQQTEILNVTCVAEQNLKEIKVLFYCVLFKILLIEKRQLIL